MKKLLSVLALLLVLAAALPRPVRAFCCRANYNVCREGPYDEQFCVDDRHDCDILSHLDGQRTEEYAGRVVLAVPAFSRPRARGPEKVQPPGASFAADSSGGLQENATALE